MNLPLISRFKVARHLRSGKPSFPSPSRRQESRRSLPGAFLALSHLFPAACAAITIALATHSAQAITYYWDGNNNTTGFGTASGTWAAPTTGTATAGWSTSATGTAGVLANSITTLTSDPLNFGTDSSTLGLGGGTITVSGTVNAASLRFGSQTFSNITLSGGTINFGSVALIHVGAGSTTVHTISSQITGAGTSLTKTGNTLVLSGANTYTGNTIISSGTLILATTNALGSIPGTNGTSGISMAASTVLQSAITGSNPINTIAAPITLSGAGDAGLRIGQGTAGNTHTFNMNGVIGGTTGNLVFSTSTGSFNNGFSLFVLGAASTYTGNTLITSGNGGNNPVFVKNGVVNALPVTTVLNFAQVVGNGTGRSFQYDLNGYNQTLAGLSNTGVVPSLRRMNVTSPTAATLTINNAADFTFGGADLTAGSINRAQIQGAIALTKNGAGTFTLGGTLAGGATAGGNTFTGDTKILGGILSLGETTSIQNSAFDTTNSIAGNGTNGLRTTVTALTLGGITGNKNFADVFTTTTGGFSGLTALTLNPGTGTTPSYSGNIADGATGMTLTKSGAGTQTLAGANSFTGATTVDGGTLTLDYSTQDNSKLSDTAALILGGGTLNLSGGTHTEIVLSTTLTANTSSRVTRGSGAAVLQLGAITPGVSASIDFGAPGIATIDNFNNAYGVIGSWATVDGRFAVNSTNAAGGLLTAGNSADVTRLNGGPQVIADSSTTNVRIIEGTGTAANITLGASTTTINTLSQSASGGTSAATIDSGTRTLRTNAILVATGAGALTIGNGTLTPAVAGGDLELANSSAASDFRVDSVINNHTSASTLTKTGIGTVTLTAANTFSGITTVSAGALRVGGGSAGALGTTAAGTVVSGTSTGSAANARLELDGGVTITGEALTISGSGNFTGALTSTSGSNEWAGNVTIAPTGAGITRLGAAAGATLTVSGVIDSGAVNTGLGIRGGGTGLTGVVVLSGANTYLGDTQVIIGKLQLDGGNNRLPTTTKMSMGNTTSFSEFDLNGRSQELAGLSIVSGATAANQSVNNSSVTPSILTVNTAAASPSTFAGILKGNLALTKSGTDALTLSGTNTYTGSTVITGGTLALGSPSSLPAITSLAMVGGKLDLNGQNATIQSLAVGGADVIIDFGTASVANTLQITNGVIAGWTGNLLIHHFNPGTDQLFFGSSAAGISGNAARVLFVDPVGLAPGNYALIPGADGAALLGSNPVLAPTITTQPASQTIASGFTATLSVVATGSPAPDYQWYRGGSGDTSTPVGANSASFITPTLTATTGYWVRATNSQGSADSQTATITVVTPLPDLAVSISGPVTVHTGDLFEYVVTVTNVGTAPVPAADLIISDSLKQLEWLSYQFVGGSNIVFPSPVNGILNGNFETLPLQPGEQDVLMLRMRVPTGATGTAVITCTVDSFDLFVEGDEANNQDDIQTVLAGPLPVAPVITTQPASQTIVSGASATLTVAASGEPAPTFQWYVGTSGDTSNPIPAATTNTYTTPPLTSTTSYWARASNTQGFADSNTATVEPLSTNSSLANLVISSGTLSRATGKGFFSGTTSYMVYLSNATTGFSVTPTAVESGSTIKVNGNTVLSGTASTPVMPAVGANAAISIVVTAPDGVTTTTYNVSTFRAAPALTSPAVAFTGYNADGIDNIAFVALADIPQNSVFHFSDNEWNGQPLGAGGAFTDSNECEFVWIAPAGGISAGTVVAIGNLGSLANPNITSTSGSAAFSEPSGRGLSATSETLHIFQGSTETPEVFHAAISTDPALQLAGTNLVLGVSAIALSTASDGGAYAAGRNDRPAFVDYLPQVNSPANWTDIGNGDGNTLLPFDLTSFTLGTANATLSISSVSAQEGNSGTSTFTFTVTRSNNGGAFTVHYATHDVEAAAGSDYVAASGDLEFTAGGPSSLPITVTINGDTGYEPDETFEVNLSNVVSTFGTTSLFESQGIGRILDDDKTAPAIVTQPVGSTIPSGTTATLTVEVSGGPVPSLQWYVGNSGDTSNPVPGATNLTFTTPALSATTGYWVRATNALGSADSNTAMVTVLPSPEILVEQPAGTPLATGEIRAFGSGLVGTTSAAKTFVIHNTGNAPLENLQVTLGGSHPGDFTADLQQLVGYASVLPAGLQAGVPVVFNPTAAGARSATLTITSNDVDENSIVVSLSGTGVFPSVIDGNRASNEGYTPLTVQTLPTSAGSGDVLANLCAKQDVSRLNLFLGGRASAGNSILLFIDSKPGGVSFISNDLITSGGEAEYINNLGTSPTSGLTFETGFNPDFAIRIYGTGTGAFVNRYDLQSRTRVYAGNSGAGNQTSGFIADMRTDWRDPVGASGSIEYGVEMALNIPGLGMTPGVSSLRMMAVLVNDSSTSAYNQVLAPLATNTDIGGSINSIDFQAVQGIQTVSFEVDNSDVDGDGDPDATDPDDDNDGLQDIHETGTGLFVSATNTGTNSKDPDTDGDGVNDGAEANGSGLGFVSNPNIPNYASMAVPGDFTTPMWKEDGSAGNAMTRVGSSLTTQYQWILDYHFTAPATPVLFKFAANGSWNVNWGGFGTPGVAELAGSDLAGMIQDSGIYRFSFDQGTSPPSYSLVRISFPDLASYLAAYGLTGLAETDSDNDGLTNAQEFQINSDPKNADSDGDGTNDFLPEPPAITTQPLASQSIANGATASLSVAASGLPLPTFQWYRGTSGNTANPVSGATSANFTSPALTVTTSYWVRASNASGHADSATATVNVALSPNADLSALALGQTALSPVFTPATVAYTASVPGETAQVGVTPTTAHPNATVEARVNGGTYSAVSSGAASGNLALNVGSNTVEVRVTAQDGTTKLYTITVTRERAPDLVVGLTAPGTVNMGAEFDYVLTLSNISPVAYPGVWALRLDLPAGVELVGFPSSNPASAPASVYEDVVYFSGTGFPANQLQTFRVTAKCTLPGTYRVPAGFAGLFITSSYEENYGNNSNAAEVVTEALPVYSAPVVVTQVVSNQIITSGNTASLTFAASGYPAPTYQWYRGPSGDFSNPINGATSPGFTTPALAVTTSYWVRSGNSEGSVDSVTATVEVVPPSSNTYLAGLSLNQGILTPAFSPFVTDYAVSVPNSVASVRITPVTQDPAASAKVNGTPVASGTASGPVSLQVGANTVVVLVTAEDDSSTMAYNLTVTRSQPLALATAAADGVTATTALLHGTVTPFDPAVVYFQYGTTTSYGGSTAGQDVTGPAPVSIQANLTGITGNTLYHFRMVAMNSGGTTFGNDMTFTTAPEPPVAATGAPSAVSTTGATLVGAVNPKGLPVEVIFEYGPTNLYGYATAVQNFPAGNTIINVTQPITGLTADGIYHFRIIANSAAGTTDGGDVSFIAKTTAVTGGGDPTAVPAVTTGGVSAITDQTAILQGTANPMGGPTVVYFQYGTTAAYGLNTATQSIGNGAIPVVVDLPAGNLPSGSTVHYRLVASNSLGASQGNDATFTTKFAKPDVGTGEAVAISTTSVRVSGFARANRADATVIVEYGPDPSLLNRSVNATPFDISGDSYVPVQAEITDLAQGGTYYYRVSATNTGGTGKGILRSFNVGVLSGLLQEFPAEITSADRSGSVTLNLTPSGIGGGWRFSGEQQWRTPGSAATGLTTGDRIVEFRPAPGYLQPTDEAVAVNSGGLPVVLSRSYTASGATGSGELTVTILPAGIASNSVPAESRAQWRLFGESDAQWKDSGAVVSGLVPGDYVVESKPVAGRTTPGQIAAGIVDGQTTLATTTYFIAESTAGTPPAVLDFTTVSTREDRPFAYVGQIRSDAGSSTGFVVRPRVVATAGHVVFDDGTLAATTGLQWLFQRDRGVHEPKPQIPRGYYLMTGYGAQRAADNTPGTSTPQSQNLDAAAIYFQENAGRGGFSGYLASDSLVNEFLTSNALKTLVGYPLDGIPAQDQGRMHATPLANIGFSSAFGRTYTTADIRSRGGNSGGPLCVLNSDGVWYPAAIYLGGSNETVVRAIDSDVLNLFGFAEVSGNASAGSTGGGFTLTDNSPNGTPGLASLRVLIEPAAARSGGGGWRIQAQASYAASGARLDNLDPNTYTVQLAAVSGFVPPSSQTVTVQGGQLRTVTFTYEEIIPPPVITSPSAVTVTRGQPLNYQITANNSPQFFFLQGVLPIGMDFNSTIGLITGTPQEAGQFIVNVGATNAGGSDTRQVVLTSLPVLASQQATTSYQTPFDYQIVSSESGSALTFTAGSLPAGLVLNSATGRITGSPTIPGVYAVPISVAKAGAVSSATLTLTILGSPPVITLNPLASKTVEFGQSTTLTVAADGLPVPSIQWYQGISGNVANPVPGATANTFVTPALAANTSYWARASSISGAANSLACAIQVVPSSNANLANLGLSSGDLTPGFNPGISSYAVLVPNAVASINLTPVVQISQSIARVNGLAVISGSASAPIALAVGANNIAVQVTAGNGTSVRTYTLTVTRGLAATVSTAAATAITDVAGTLNGAVTPFSNATAFFQYGLTNSYGNTTPPQGVSGNVSVPVAATLAGLTGSTVYHYRLAVSTAGGTVYGQDMTFTTTAAKPLVATGDPGNVTTSEATLIGAVNPRGLDADVHLEYGPTNLYGTVTPVRQIVAGNIVVNVTEDISGLIPGNTYHCRIVATSAAGTSLGNDISFTAEDGGGSGGTGVVTALPIVTTGGIADLTTASASLQGTVNPKGGITFAYFEYGPTNAYGSKTEPENKGNGNQLADVTKGISGLLPGMTYHYRLVASNSLGTRFGNDATFVSGYFPPIVATGGAAALTSTSARVNGTVMARGANSEVYFDYGTDGITFPNSVRAFQQFVGGDIETPVNVDLLNLDGAITYYYRVRAVSSGGEGLGSAKPMQVGALAGLVQDFTRDVPTDDRQGQVIVNLLPAGTGAWRFAGEQQWRQSGIAVSSLTTSDREIEYQPVPGYIQPPSEVIAVVSGAPILEISRFYYETDGLGTAGLRVTLKPDSLTGSGVPVANRAQWRLVGAVDPSWHDSGEEIADLRNGSYLVECKSIAGWSSPAVNTVNLGEGGITNATITYFPASAPSLNPPVAVPFSTVSTTRNLPYAYVGQVRTNSGSHSGFVVKPRVVATAAQAIFDEETLAVASGTQWLLQRDRGTYEPEPVAPRGFYVFDGYTAQRRAEATPGTLAVQSQNLNVAALYFAEDAGRGGFSGFLASDAAQNEFLQSSELKTLVGYPINGIASANQGRMHATTPSATAFTLSYGRTYTSAAIRGIGGMTGGPLCVQYQGGSYFPAGIYVGGTTQGAVRAIDASVIGLFTRAETSANGGDNNTDGGYTQSSYNIAGTSSGSLGRIKVIILPEQATTDGARWQLSPDTTFFKSGDELTAKSAGDYKIQFRQIAGYQTPPTRVVATVEAGKGTLVTYTYLKDVPPPLITSAASSSGTRGKWFKYEIAATNEPDSYSLQSGVLPAGITLGATSGNIYGTLGEAGAFTIRVKAKNDGGSDSLDMLIVSYPNVADQTASVLLGQPLNYKISSSESGSEVTYSASNLPQGVSFNTSTGRLTGSPLVSGVFNLPITVTKGGATSAAVLTLTVTTTALDSWRLENLGTTSTTGDAANNADPDGDGKTNIEEYAAGTLPRNAADFFRVTSTSRTGSIFTATAEGRASRTYVLERRASLDVGPWTTVATVGPLAADGPVNLPDPASPVGSCFYRFRVSAP